MSSPDVQHVFDSEVEVYGSILRNRVSLLLAELSRMAAADKSFQAEDWLRELRNRWTSELPEMEVSLDLNGDERRMLITRIESERLGQAVLYRRMSTTAAQRVRRLARQTHRIFYGCDITLERVVDEPGYIDVYVQANSQD